MTVTRHLITFFLLIKLLVGTNVDVRSAELSERIDCFPEAESKFSYYSKDNCLARGCLFDEWSPAGVIQCYVNPNYGYILRENAQQTSNGIRLRLRRNQAVSSMFPSPIENVVLDVQHYTNDIIRFRLYDEDNQRYEVPIPLSPASAQVSSPQYEFIHGADSSRGNAHSFSIKRRSNQATLFDTSLGGLILNDQFLQIVTRLQSPHVYGFGENNHDTLKHNVNERKTWGIFARDQGTHWGSNANQYGSHPFYLVMEQTSNSGQSPSGNMHGVLLLNSNAMDYTFSSVPSLTMRTIGGILDFFVFLGPKPEQVVQQYTWLVGRSILPPYWSLGFQIARWDYGNLTHMQRVVKRNRDAGVPISVLYADIDYMDAEKDFTIDPINFRGMKEYFAELNADGIRTIVILDPATVDDQVHYAPTIEGIREDVFIKWDDGKTLMKGSCWPGDVFFPDFFTNRTQNWWSRWIKDFRRVNLTFDGLWIDMNEPALFDTNEAEPWNSHDTGSTYTLKCPISKFDDPPYRTKAAFRYDGTMTRPSRLSDRTLCLSAQQGEIDMKTGKPKYRHYDVHNLYGWSQTKPTLDAMQQATGKRSLVLPRSTFVGSGQWSGHWLGDNGAKWEEMKRSLIGMVEFNWFGIPFNGADICGFDGIPSEEMCIRWMQLGAFYPFSRNHNIWKLPDQDPAVWSPSAVAIMISALHIRYTLLPYYYTLFYKAHTQGSTVIRPLFHEYPTDKTTLDIFLQFLIGSGLMIAPVTDDGGRYVQVYIPSSHWYNFHTGARIAVQKQYIWMSAPLDTIPIFIKGGAILPTQGYAENTKFSRQKPFGLIVALDANSNAEGDLFYDDGESIDTVGSKAYYYATFRWSSNTRQLTINVIENNYSSMSNLTLDTLTIYGLNDIPLKFTANNKDFTPTVRPQSQIIEVTGLKLPMGASHAITWQFPEIATVQRPDFINKDPKYRIDCHPDPNASDFSCRNRGCIWDTSFGNGIVACVVPQEKGGYALAGTSQNVSDAMTHYGLSRISAANQFSLFGKDINKLNVQVSVSGTDMIRLTIRDSDAKRYEVPVPIRWNPVAPSSSNGAKIKFEMTKNENGQAGFRVRRTNTNSILFDTSFFAEGFIYDDKYIQMITTIPSRNVYGFGENTHQSFRHVLKGSHRYGVFARDQPPYGGHENLYGTQPFYMVIENDGQTFGILIFNSNAQDYKFDEFSDDQAMLTYRTIGGILDVLFFAGSHPEDVIRQYQQVIGTPYMPPYWALGFQLCRYGQRDNIWIKWPTRRNVQYSETGNRNMVGYVWPDGKTVFPDFFYPPAKQWWKSQVVNYYSQLKFDGLWIDMNEPANFDTNREKPFNWNRPEPWSLHCPLDEPLETPKYKTSILGDYLSDKTLCMIGEQTDEQGNIYTHYDVHNLYGWSETMASLPAARATDNKRSVVISRSTFPTSGSFSGHWLGDNSAQWSHLKYNIIGMLEFNLFGIPYVGADICGFEGDTTEQMCQRWMQLGAFNPFFRNHNGLKFRDHDPGNFAPAAVASNRQAVITRYQLIPYLYTLFHRVHISGGTVVRSMGHEFPSITDCLPLDEQFLWGSHLLIAPVIYENNFNKWVYLPTTERWFDYYTGEEKTTLGAITVPAPLDFIPLFLRGGAIIPHQLSALNTVMSRKKPMYLIVALDNKQQATGDLFWDDGESIDTYEKSIYNYFIFNCDSSHLTIDRWTYKYPEMGSEIKLEEIKIFGINKQPNRITWNGQDLTPMAKWTFDPNKNILIMKDLALDFSKTHKFAFLQ
ncbi:unnamed protein product [Rotaria socialis]|uniref:Maltase n=1 Tax=Rotaria socialis TaxID=392032 RepID=A0A821K6T2_9BILA|nr:unnamed protein product [Rotaria socialis]